MDIKKVEGNNGEIIYLHFTGNGRYNCAFNDTNR